MRKTFSLLCVGKQDFWTEFGNAFSMNSDIPWPKEGGFCYVCIQSVPRWSSQSSFRRWSSPFAAFAASSKTLQRINASERVCSDMWTAETSLTVLACNCHRQSVARKGWRCEFSNFNFNALKHLHDGLQRNLHSRAAANCPKDSFQHGMSRSSNWCHADIFVRATPFG